MSNLTQIKQSLEGIANKTTYYEDEFSIETIRWLVGRVECLSNTLKYLSNHICSEKVPYHVRSVALDALSEDYMVSITINKKIHNLKPGNYSAEFLMNIAGIESPEQICHYTNNCWVDFEPKEIINICGGESFVSHIPSSGSI